MEVLSTTEYDLFKRPEGQRPLNPRRVKLIADFMQIHGFIESFPVIIHSDMTVVDGQHRLEAAKIANVPVFYVVNDELPLDLIPTCGGLNDRWHTRDFIYSHADRGVESYEWLIGFACQFGFTGLNTTLAIIGGDLFAGRNGLREGTWKATPERRQKALRFATMINDWRHYLPRHYTSSPFIAAYRRVNTIPEFSHHEMLRKIALQPTEVKPCISSEQYVDLIDRIYNFKNKNKINFAPARKAK